MRPDGQGGAEFFAPAGVRPADVTENLLQLIRIGAASEFGFVLPGGNRLWANQTGAWDGQPIWSEGDPVDAARGIIGTEIDGVDKFAVEVDVLRTCDLSDGTEFNDRRGTQSVGQEKYGRESPGPLTPKVAGSDLASC